MNRTLIYAVLLTLLSFLGGLLAGIKLAEPDLPNGIDLSAIQRLRERAHETHSVIAEPVVEYREVIKYVKKEEAKIAEDLRDAAGKDPEFVAAFSLTPDKDDSLIPPTPSGGEAEVELCLPWEFFVDGTIQAFDYENAALHASITHAHADQIIWTAPLGGRVTFSGLQPPRKEPRWLLGATIGWDSDNEWADYEYGVVGGYTFRHVGALFGASTSGLWAGVIGRW